MGEQSMSILASVLSIICSGAALAAGHNVYMSAFAPKIVLNLDTYEKRKQQKVSQILLLALMLFGVQIAISFVELTVECECLKKIVMIVTVVLIACQVLIVICPKKQRIKKMLEDSKSFIRFSKVIFLAVCIEGIFSGLYVENKVVIVVFSVATTLIALYLILTFDLESINMEYLSYYKYHAGDGTELYIYYKDSQGAFICGEKIDVRDNRKFTRVLDKDLHNIIAVDNNDIIKVQKSFYIKDEDKKSEK